MKITIDIEIIQPLPLSSAYKIIYNIWYDQVNAAKNPRNFCFYHTLHTFCGVGSWGIREKLVTLHLKKKYYSTVLN